MASTAAIVPSLALSMGGMIFSPLVTPAAWDAKLSYFERLAVSFTSMRLWLAMTVIIGLMTGWACRRREQSVFGCSSWFWPIVVGCFGWFGWIGYCCIRPLPARLPGGAWLPSQPEPNRPIGTEIFA